MNQPDLLTPRNLAGLAAALSCATPNTRLIAGGTDLMLRLHTSAVHPDLLIDLSGLSQLSFIRKERCLIRVGAMTTFAHIKRDAILEIHASCLARAAAHVGSEQIRNVATIGGNIANASACADAIPALLVLDTQVGVLNRAGNLERRPLRDLLGAESKTTLRHDEAIVDFSFAPTSGKQRSAFAKVGARASVAVAKLNAAIVVSLDETQRTISDARVAFGSVASTAFVDDSVAQVLRGKPVNSSTLESFESACSSTVNRSIPNRSSLPYKRHAIRGIAHDLWSAIQDARDP